MKFMLLIALLPTLILGLINIHLYSVILDLQAKVLLLENNSIILDLQSKVVLLEKKIVYEPISAVEKSSPLNFELILIGVVSIVLLIVVFKGVNFVGDTATYKVIKLFDKKISSFMDYFISPESTMSFVEKSTGYQAVVKTSGENCEIMFRSSEVGEYLSLKKIIEFSDKIITENYEVIDASCQIADTVAADKFFS